MNELAEQTLKDNPPEDNEPPRKRVKTSTKSHCRQAEEFTGPAITQEEIEQMNNELENVPGIQYQCFVPSLVVSIGEEAADAVLASKDSFAATVISTIQGTYWAVERNQLDDGNTFIFKQEKPIGVGDGDILNNKELLLWFNPDEKSGHRGWWISEKVFQGNKKHSGPFAAGAVVWMPRGVEDVLIPPYESVHVPYHSKQKYSGITVEPLQNFTMKLFERRHEQADGDENNKPEYCGPVGRVGLGRWDRNGNFHKGGWLNRACDIMGALTSGHYDWAHMYVEEYMLFPKAKNQVRIWCRHFGGGGSGR